MLTHLRDGIYATQMEELCKTSPFRRSFFRTADGAVSKGGSLWFPFFRPFFVKRQRKGIFAFTERAQLDGVEVGCSRPKEKLLKVQLNLLQLFLLTLTLHFVRARCAAYAYSLPCRKE